MVGVVAGERVVTELIQDACTPEAVARETIELLTKAERIAEMKLQLAVVRERLGGSGASARAADAVLEVARQGAAVRARTGNTTTPRSQEMGR